MRRSHARSKRVDSKPNNTNTSTDTKMDPNPNYPMKKLHKFRSTNLFSQSSKHNKPTSNTNLVLTLISISAILGASIFFVKYYSVSGPQKYQIIIDGGSTGTRIHVLKYSVASGGVGGGRDKNKAAFNFEKGGGLVSMRVNPGLSAYAEDPEGAGESLTELLEFAKQKVEEEYWKDTEIRLMATAGLRLLDVEIREKILVACRGKLRASGFNFRDEWASVITGSDEGVNAWVVANYALGTLGGDPMQTTGIVELGGASAQVTFVSSEPMPSEFSRAVEFGNLTYNLYSHSFLHFGQNAAFEALRELLVAGDFDLGSESFQKGIYTDPCSPKGYLHETESWKLSPGSLSENKHLSALQSSGNFSECRSAALMLLRKGKEKCSYEHCYIGSTFMPKLKGKILATENFFHTSKFFGLGPRAHLSDMVMAGQQFCGDEWSKLKKKYHSLDEEDLLRYCFSSAYIVALLHDSLGIALEAERVQFANQVGNIPLDWALGAFILQSASDLHIQHYNWFATVMSDDSPRLLSLVAISIILIFIAWSVSKWRKPQLKTIYDLEKGRYIVTRIGRS